MNAVTRLTIREAIEVANHLYDIAQRVTDRKAGPS
jgi:hypothetical protein